MPSKYDIPKTIKIGDERFKLIGNFNTKTEAQKKADWYPGIKGKKFVPKKLGLGIAIMLRIKNNKIDNALLLFNIVDSQI